MRLNSAKPLLLLLSLCFTALTAFAQKTGDIRGTVLDGGTGEPVIFTSVFLLGTGYGAVTDLNGFFTIARVPAGEYTLRCTYLGYDTVDIKLSLGAGEILTKRIFLKENTFQLGNVDVTAVKQRQRTEVMISTTKITPKQIKQIPAVGGEPDLAQYLQVLPGVIFTGDQGGQLYIRGGSPIQNKILLDGMVIYNPFHSIGFFSVFETDIIRHVDVITGGFDAEYGGRISAIVDVTTKDGNKKHLAGKVSGGPFMSKLMLEGPISRLKESGGGSSSFILTGKTSYLNKTSKTLYSYVDSAGLPYSFTDLYGKMSLNAQNGSKLNFFGFNFRDRVNFFGTSEFNWDALGFGTNFVLVPSGSSTLINGNFSYSNYGMTFKEGDENPDTSAISGFNLGMDFTYFLPYDGVVKYGVEILGFKTVFQFFNPLGVIVDQNQNTTELAGYVSYKRVLNKLVLQPSLRLHYYASLGTLSPEPRLGMKLNVSPRVRLKMATGLYSQNLISAASDQDVVNLFIGFLSGPDESIQDTDGSVAKFKLQRSAHLIIGSEFDLSQRWELNVEAYYKRFGQLININRNKVFAADPNYMIEEGNARGLDFLLKYDYKRWFVWGVYSLGYVDRFDGDQTYNPHFDRRHNVNFLLGYTFGKDLEWEASGRWNLGSGFPFTRTQGFYEKFSFLGDQLNTDFIFGTGDVEVVYQDELNQGRLPVYHRLDLSLKRRFALSTSSILEITASVTNVYNRENIFYFDRIRYQRINQLPILPSLSASLSF